ncbi:MAG: DEAD/DEAH box helicase [Bacteroidetes bacterium]|nr:MAG: DEAD/DEAH box helicase [Bacteroidota bacterium]TAG89801.1 MAG: DEAD/DEAH box helicase [Bacteroidota bacterium]
MQEKNLFAELNISAPILKAIEDMGFTTPSAIQEKAIPVALAGRDLIGQAQTGTGKTASFAIPALEKIDTNVKGVQTLILCPTRELAVQVSEEIKKLAKYLDIYVLAIYGGDSIEKQIKFLRKGVHIVVGTPGRVMDHLDRGTLKLDNINTFVLDEADEMLNMGFRDDIEVILQQAPKKRQTLLFSATMPKPILDLTKNYQNNPELVKIVYTELTSANIEQVYFRIHKEDRLELMKRLIDVNGIELSIVFCNTKQGVDELVEELRRNKINAEGLHGDMSQAQRNQVMAKFKNRVVNALVATDVAARGIDVDNVEAVFNFDIPFDPEYYVHRIGRTGRAGKLGKSFTFLSDRRDIFRLKDIEKFAKITIEQGQIPHKGSIVEIQKKRFTEKLKYEISLGKNEQYENFLASMLEQGMNTQDIALALLKMYANFKDQGQERDNLQQIQDNGGSSKGSRDRGGRSDNGGSFGRGGRDRDRGGYSQGNSGAKFGGRDRGQGQGQSSWKSNDNQGESKFRSSNQGDGKMVRLYLNVGKNQKIRKMDVLGAIAGETGVPGQRIGAIDIFGQYSFVDVQPEDAKHIINTMNKSQMKGQKVNFEIASN